MDFKQKVVIITGASSGIGEATAKLLANLSANLVLTGRNEDRLKDTAKICDKSKGNTAFVVQADLTKDAEVKKIVDETIKRFGKIDVLINNAGAGAVGRLSDSVETFDRMINTNLRSVYLLTHYAAPHIIKTKGNIVNVSSIGSMYPNSDFMQYCVAKAGLDMFTKCIAKELAKHGVRVTSVNPGPVTSEFHHRLGLTQKEEDDMMKQRLEASPLGRITTSEECADLIAFLASDQAKSMTGSINVIDNGYMLR